MMIYKPNYSAAEQEAYKLLIDDNIRKLPVKVKKIAKKFPDLQIKSYSWYAKNWDLTIKDVCELVNSDEGCCWYLKSQKKYLILYNDLVEHRGRIRWTIAHELGHYLLKHNEKINKPIISRNSLSEEEYEVFEKEANCFARTLLAPPPVITKFESIDAIGITQLCNISFEAAVNIFSFLQNGKQMGVSYQKHSSITKMFSGFIFNQKNKHYCFNCQSEFVCKKPDYCPICGKNELRYPNKFSGVEVSMIYTKIELNEVSKPHCCPRCENEELAEGGYCQVCGSYVINKCSGYYEGEYDQNSQFNYKPNWHELDDKCDTLLEGVARFCHKCGSTSTYSEVGHLVNWVKEKGGET